MNNHIRQLVFGIILGVLAFGLTSTVMAMGEKVGGQPPISERKIIAVNTTNIVNDIVRSIGGDRVEAISLMGPGVDPHLYRASEGDVARLARADIIFYNGLHLEAKMAEVLEQLGSKKRTVAVAESIPKAQLLSPPEFEGSFDPHVWFDLALWSNAVRAVAENLIAIDPEHEGEYRRNVADYLAKMARIDEDTVAKVSHIPKDQRVLITAHDAFNYFGRAYGFEVKGLQGISTESEAGIKDVQELADFIVARKIKAIFVESSIPKRNIEAVQRATLAKGWEVKIGGELFSDALGAEGTREGTYLGMIDHNVATVTGALTGKATAQK